MSPIVDVVNRMNFGLEQGFCTIETRPQSGIDNSILDGIAKSSRGNQRILLGMYADANVVPNAGAVSLSTLATYAAPVKAIGHSFGCPIVPRRDDAIVLNDHGADPPAQAVRLPADSHGNTHVVIVSGDHIRSALQFESSPHDRRRTPAVILPSLFGKSKGGGVEANLALQDDWREILPGLEHRAPFRRLNLGCSCAPR